MKLIVICLCLLHIMTVTSYQTVRIFSTSTLATFCDTETLYGSQGYIEKVRETSTQLCAVESGYENIHLYMVLPTHFGCQLNELEIVVVSPLPHLPDQEYVDLSADIQNNINESLEIKLIIIDCLLELPLAILSRLRDIHRPAIQENMGNCNSIGSR